MKQLRRAVAVTTAALTVFVGLALPAGAATTKGDSVGASVAPGSQTDPKGSYFVLDEQPGATVTQSIVLENSQSHPIEAHLESVDATTGDATGVTYALPNSQPTLTGTWVTVQTPVVTLQPNEKRSLPFTVTVPAGTKPGQYIAGLSAWVPLPAAKKQPALKQGTGFSVSLQPRRVIAVEIDVPGGPLASKLAVTGARATATPDGVALLLGLSNTGNAFARGNATVSVNDTGLQTHFTINTFVAGTQIEYRIPWTKDVVTGTHAVSAVLRYGNNQQTTWNGNVVIDQSTGAKLEASLAKTRIPVHKSFPFVLVLLGLGVVVLCGLAALVVRRRRSGGRGTIAVTRTGSPTGDGEREFTRV
jgi:WxL Interacting Protein, peptidoglycan binding domain